MRRPPQSDRRAERAGRKPDRAGPKSQRKPERRPERRPERPQDRKPDRTTETSPRVPVPRGAPLPGTWIWATRPGAETDLSEELELALGGGRARALAVGLVRSEGAPTFDDGSIDATFARQGFVLDAELQAAGGSLVLPVLDAIGRMDPKRAFGLSSYTADSDEGNRLSGQAHELERAVRAGLLERDRRPAAIERLRDVDGTLVNVVVLSADRALVGRVSALLALSLHAGGRARMRVDSGGPSRAARKVEEALAWLGVAPGPGELCIDLGAAPGGWSWSLLERRARVIAVDPAALRPDVARHRGMRHEKVSAFQYAPPEPADWLFCDMAWRPAEVAQALAKWGRRGWARILVANLKLPMKRKAETVRELREIVAGGGWKRVRTRQLYHDRDEITLTAYR